MLDRLLLRRLGITLVGIVCALSITSCDTGESNRSGTVSSIEGDLICIVPEDREQATYCSSASPDELLGVAIGDCVRMRSYLAEPLGGVGTPSEPEELRAITRLDRPCQKP
jgi:hypothetical protein